MHAAIGLYERNTKLSEAFYTPLQCLEVCLRNSVHEAMTDVYGEDWFHGNNAPLESDSRRMILDAKEELIEDRKPVIAGQMLAELKFAFWVGLLGKHYDATIWRKAIYKAFLAHGGKPRGVVHSRMNAIRRLRNRIAHHEPVFQKLALMQSHDEIIDAISWMCRDTSAWAKHHSRFQQVFAEPVS
ncbi:Abi family protein [Bradyrhizobium japonicum]|uniref:Abi family protein n=1 Tax=Bradyrhizobium japonicum TaxID=375 RepID=UPI001BAE00ED|nr:Abi family protein [Bradyrhizobium japonicum]MBR0806205.1 Abi family protein [Bradyrhizobium japonicum]